MENRRIMPGLYKGYPESLRKKDKEERDHTDPMYNHKKAEGTRMKSDDRRDSDKESKKSYTIDEITTAQLLKGHPQAQEILDFINKGKKNESGEEFQDGSEDTIGNEGHASVARPATVHDGAKGGNHPGVKTTKESQQKSEGENNDMEKSDNLTDNLPEEFEEGIEEDDTIPAEKSMSEDESTINFLSKSWGSEHLEKAISSLYTTPGALSKKTSGGYEGVKTMKELDKFKEGKPSELDPKKPLNDLKTRLGTDTSKSNNDNDIEKSKEEQAEWAKDPEGEKREHMSEKSWSLDFSKSILTNMGLEKGSPSVSKKVAGGKATQISYSSKPETRFKHPKQKTGETRYEHNVKEGTVTKKESTGEKGKFKEGKPIPVSDEKKLKNASEGGFDLHKALDTILEKKTRN